MSKSPTKKNEIINGIPSGKHEDMRDVLQGWDKRENEQLQHNAKVQAKSQHKGIKTVHKSGNESLLPSELDPNYTYGLTTEEIDIKSDPFLHSNQVIAQRKAQQERELKRREALAAENKEKPTKKIDPLKPTAASMGHTHHPPAEPGPKDTFKMKRFTKFEHGKIDTGLRKPKTIDEENHEDKKPNSKPEHKAGPAK